MNLQQVNSAKDTAEILEPYYNSALKEMDLLGSAREPQSSRVQALAQMK